MALTWWSQAQVLAQLDSTARWYEASITYSFPVTKSQISGPFGETRGFLPLNANQQSATKLAMTLWDELMSTSCFQVVGQSNIEFGNSTTMTDYAHAYFPANGSVWFSAKDSALLAPKVGEYEFETFLHEIGHAFGLDHMGGYNGGGNSSPSCYQDSTVYSIMSYFGPDHRSGEGQVAWADWVGDDGKVYSPQTPMLSDIQAIQAIYGADLKTREGDSVYGFNSNLTGETASIYNFFQNAHPILTIYDAGGIDTLDLSGFLTPSTIDLQSGAFSSCNSMTNNIAIAYSSTIENAVGGAGNDWIMGNASSNILTGGRGNDSITGGGGFDWAVYSGSLGDYRVKNTAGIVQVTDNTPGRDGVDTLKDIERLVFKDMNLAFDVDGHAGQLVRLYEATFNRAPDSIGIGYWLNKMDAGTSLIEVAKTFVVQPEFYAANAGDADFLTMAYNHVVHRDPDQSGRDYWLNDLSHGGSRAVVMAALSESSECRNQTVDLVANGIQYTPWV